MRVFFGWCRQRVWVALLLGLWAAVFAVVLFLYGSPVEAVGYALLLCLAALLLWASVDLLFYIRRTRTLQAMAGQAELTLSSLPDPAGPLEAAYQSLVLELEEKRRQAVSDADGKQREAMDYYTLWAHQIKTPIAAARLLLQENPGAVSGEVEVEILKIEQYVEMVLSYLRMEEMSSDLAFEEYQLDDIVRQAVRKYSQMFILKRIRLDFQPLQHAVLTDEKWLVFVVEQILSNALKYTKEGSISIYLTTYREKLMLAIRDTGIGISREDLPRVFEKGFTGYNGRADKKSTGIGLYLCKKIMDKLRHGIYIESEVDQGTTVYLYLEREK